MNRYVVPLVTAAIFAPGCVGRQRHLGSYLDTMELHRCLALVESGTLKRGMRTNELKVLFPKPDALCFRGGNNATATLSQTRNNPVGYQSGPQWEITIALKDGRVADYSIAMWEGK